MHKYIFLGLMALAGCSTQAQQQIATVACAADPIAYAALKTVSVIATIVDPATVAAIGLTNSVEAHVHESVVEACSNKLPGSVPIPTTVNLVSVPVSTPVSLTTMVILPVSK